MAGISDKLNAIRKKTAELVERSARLERDNLSLKNENIELKQELMRLKAQLKEARTVHGLNAALSKKGAKRWLNEILREVEECKRIISPN